MKSLKDTINEEMITYNVGYGAADAQYDVPQKDISMLQQLNSKHNYSASAAKKVLDCLGRPLKQGDLVFLAETPTTRGAKKDSANHFWIVLDMTKTGPILYNPMFKEPSFSTGYNCLKIDDISQFMR